jgi:hypothetical protein
MRATQNHAAKALREGEGLPRLKDMKASSFRENRESESVVASTGVEENEEGQQDNWLRRNLIWFLPFSTLFVLLMAGLGLTVIGPSSPAQTACTVPSTSGGYQSDLARVLPVVLVPTVKAPIAIAPVVKHTVVKPPVTAGKPTNNGTPVITGSPAATDSDGDNDGSSAGDSDKTQSKDSDGKSKPSNDKPKSDGNAKSSSKSDGDGSGKAQGDKQESSKSHGK